MPYERKTELPKGVKDHLPEHAQEIYKEAFYHAYDEYKDPEKRWGHSSHEEMAHKVAWPAVKKEYRKKGDEWVRDKD